MATTLVSCPIHQGNTGPLSCGGELVEASGLDDFNAATVEVAPCSSLRAQGWGDGPQEVLRKTDAIERLTAPAAPIWQHRDGLVTFG